MHARHRSPGNGVRSNSVGIGGLAAARTSPEGSVRAHGMYNSEYRSFNRGFGRGSPRPYQSSQPPRRGDIFMEAGRLAAEYLVSQGFLPPTVLPGKWKNSNLKNQVGDFQDFRVQDRENHQMPSEGRTSALARLGNTVPDAGSGRRRFPDEFNPTGSRNHMRGRRRTGSFRSYGSDWGREYVRNGSWSDKTRNSIDMEGEDDFASGYHEERRVGLEGSSGFTEVISNELPLRSDTSGDSEPEPENYEFPDDTGLKMNSSSARKELPAETDCEFSKGDDTKTLNVEIGEVTAGTNNDEMNKQAAVEDISMQPPSVEVDAVNKNGNDLLRLCSFVKFPTKTRSSLMCKGSKVDPVSMNDEGNTCDTSLQDQGSKVPKEENNVESSLNGTLANQNQSSQCFESDISRAPPVQSAQDVGDLGAAYTMEGGKCSRLLPDGPFMYEQASVESPSELERCSSMVKERGEKRALQNDDTGEGTKKHREWPPAIVVHDDEYFHHTFSAKSSDSHLESLQADAEVMVAADQERLLDVDLFSKGGAESGLEFREEKQLFPSSFKICDLNLMEASDLNESHDSNPVLDLPSTFETKKEEPVDVDLSISNNCNRSDDYGRHSADVKEVSIVDVVHDSTKEEKAFDPSERTTETVHSSLESFPNHTENNGDLPDVQDGYGLMISELLGTDISNCSSVPTDITSLHTDMGLHNGAGILGDDDPIYLSLGEIPISFLGVWEQPTQQYEKPF